MIFSNHFTYLLDLLISTYITATEVRSCSLWMLFFRKQKFQGRDTMFYEVLANKNPFILQKNNFVFKVILSTNEN